MGWGEGEKLYQWWERVLLNEDKDKYAEIAYHQLGNLEGQKREAKVNISVDVVTFDEYNATGFGMIARGSSSEMISAKSVCVHSLFPPELAEALDIKEALSYIQMQGWKHNSDDGVNYALMENADDEAENSKLKVPQTILAFNTNDIYELQLFLKTLHVSYRDQTLENNRIKSENSELKKRNDHLEIELLLMLEIQKERDNNVYVKEKLLEKHPYLEKKLDTEREVIKLWTNLGKTTQEILENGCWGSGLGYYARSNSDKKIGKETEKTEPIKTNSKVKMNKVQIKTIKYNPSANTLNSIHEEGTTSAPKSNLITDKSEQVHTKSVILVQ
ncbi:hypothetical protein AgCh_016714 [Apium graveolens]